MMYAMRVLFSRGSAMLHKLAVGLAWYAIYCLVWVGVGLLWMDYRLWKMKYRHNRGVR